MADPNDESPLVRIAGKDSVNMALELLRSASGKCGKRKRNEEPCDNDKATSYCHANLVDPKESSAASGFSEHYALVEMRSCLARRDWTSLQRLFPLLLGCYSGIEPIIWRYVLILLLCSPHSDTSYFQEFLDMCIGSQTLENSHLLERILSLRNEDT